MPDFCRRRAFLAVCLVSLHVVHAAVHTARERLARLALPECAREMLLNCSFDRYTANATQPPVLGIQHAYIIHYTGNVRRRAFQMQQLPKLGVDYSFVTGYDRDFIDGHDRACMLSNSRRHDLALGDNKTLDMHLINPSYISQVIKLFGALYDMLVHERAASLILEDDAVIRYEHLPALAKKLEHINGNFTIIYSGSYNPKGTDMLPPGFYPKDMTHIPSYRGPGRMMPAVGCILSVAGASHVLDSLPIRAPVDMTLSDWRVPSAPRHHAFVFKPFAFTPGAFGTTGIFGGEGISSDLAKKAAAAPAPAKPAPAKLALPGR